MGDAMPAAKFVAVLENDPPGNTLALSGVETRGFTDATIEPDVRHVKYAVFANDVAETGEPEAFSA
jgi:hypothetical protein